MNTSTEKLSVREKIGYSLGDLSANLVFQTLMTFLAYFYTDIYKIPSGKATTIMFVGGLTGAFFNPVMGAIADRTNTRWGKFRPWILWTSMPFGTIAILAFSTPDFGENAKVIYAFVTYLLLVIVYSMSNLPYSALSGVLTGDMSERNSLSSYRFVAVMIAQFIIQSLLLPLVLIFGDGDKAKGFRIIMTFFAIIGSLFLIITFLTTKERVVPKPEQNSTLKQDLSDLFRNRPWVVMLFLTILVFITLALKNGMYIYYFENYLNVSSLANFLKKIGFNGFISGLNNLLKGMGLSEFSWPKDAPTSAFSLFSACGILFMIAGIGFSKTLADKFGKRDVFRTALFIATLFLILFNFYPPDAIGLVFITQILHGFFYGITIPLLWAMIADVADYSEWKNNRRATAIIFSAMIFGLKAGLSIGGALVAGILTIYHYDPAHASKSASTIQGIKLSVSLFPAITFFMGIALLSFYKINREMERQIESDLKLRRSKN